MNDKPMTWIYGPDGQSKMVPKDKEQEWHEKGWKDSPAYFKPEEKPKSDDPVPAYPKGNADDPRIYSRIELEGMKMYDLRPIGDRYGAKDTSKNELIAEIMKAQLALQAQV